MLRNEYPFVACSIAHLCLSFSVAYVDNRAVNERPARGTHVDSISYYTYDLADCNRNMYNMQQRKAELALTGGASFDVDTWIARLMISANEVADQIMIDSAEDNALRATYTSFDETYGVPIPQAELMSSHYGSFGTKMMGMSPRTTQCAPYAKRYDARALHKPASTKLGQVAEDHSSDEEVPPGPPKTSSSEQLLVSFLWSWGSDPIPAQP